MTKEVMFNFLIMDYPNIIRDAHYKNNKIGAKKNTLKDAGNL